MDKTIKILCGTIGRDLAELHKGDTLTGLWPFTTNEAEFYIGEDFMKGLFNTVTQLKEKGYSKDAIAKLFQRPSKIAQYLTFFHSAKILEKSQRILLAKDLINFISYYRDDPFCCKRVNILKKHSFDTSILDIKLIDNHKIINIEKELTSLLLMYLEILFPTAMRLGHEFHGPYLKNGRLLLVKEFYNLKPKYFSFSKIFPFKNLIFIEEIKENPKIDFFNHLFYMPERKKVSILLEGKLLNESEYKELSFTLESVIKKICVKVNKYSRKKFLEILANGYFFSLEKLKKELNEEVKVPDKVLNKIRNERFFLDRDKIKNQIDRYQFKELSKKITKSFLEIFK
jgi:hypothetical protein